MHIDYALLCEFATLSNNGLHSFMHVFDKTTFQKDTPMGVRGFFAVKFSELPSESELEIYMTDSENVIIEQGKLMKGKVKGPGAQIVFRMAIGVPKPGTYVVWGRQDGGEPTRLLQWIAEEKVA